MIVHHFTTPITTPFARKSTQIYGDLRRLWEKAKIKESAKKPEITGLCRLIKGYKIMIKVLFVCHGHTCGVKTSLLTAGLKAEQDHLDAFLFGHTHKPLVDKRGRTLFLNPGTVGKGLRPTYGILTVEGDRIDGRTVFLDSES